MPLIPALSGARDPAWRDVLLQLLDSVEAARHVARRRSWRCSRACARSTSPRSKRRPTRCFAQRFADVDPASAPFIMAALQVVWTDLATDIDKRRRAVARHPGPVPGVRLASGREHRCASAALTTAIAICTARLCATEWHMVRVKCATANRRRASPITWSARRTPTRPRAKPNRKTPR